MNAEQLTYLLAHPNKLTNQDFEKLKIITSEFPYFQAAKAIQLKGLYQSKSYKYNNALKKTAAHTIDRKVLFEFITSTLFLEKKSQSETQISPIKKNATVLPEIVIEQTENKETDILELGKPIKFNSAEPLTFNEWMQLATQKPIQRENKAINKLNIIDQFIKTNPKIKPVSKQQANFDISKESSVENENLMTETLAKVYLEQKKYSKAIKAYHILSLKYPEKSSFFANRIKAIKIITNK